MKGYAVRVLPWPTKKGCINEKTNDESDCWNAAPCRHGRGGDKRILFMPRRDHTALMANSISSTRRMDQL